MPSHESVKRGLPPAQVGKVPIGVDVSKSGEPPAVGYELVESSDLAGGGGATLDGAGDLARFYNAAGSQVIPDDGSFHIITLPDTIVRIADGWSNDEDGGTSFDIDAAAATVTMLRSGLIQVFYNFDISPPLAGGFLSIGQRVDQPLNTRVHSDVAAAGGKFMTASATDEAGGNGGGYIDSAIFPVNVGDILRTQVAVTAGGNAAATLDFVDIEYLMVTPTS